jgi:hypothetical protein
VAVARIEKRGTGWGGKGQGQRFSDCAGKFAARKFEIRHAGS